MNATSITLRLREDEKAIIQDYASAFGQTISEFIRTAALEKIENETDLRVWQEAKAEFDADPQTLTAAEMAQKYV